MKWVTAISCLLLLCFAESKDLPRRYRDVETHVPQSQLRIETLRDMDVDTEILFVGVFSQFLQQATFDEVHKLVEDVTAFVKKCFADGFAGPGCKDSLFSFIPDQICAAKGLPEKYGYADCCAKADSERNDCLISHKNETPGFIPPLPKPGAQEVCTQFQANPKETVQRYIYERARRQPNNIFQAFFQAADEYKTLLTKCCQVAEKELCFKETVPPASIRKLEYMTEPGANCLVLKTFGTKGLEFMEHILLSQQFPRADVSTVFIIAKHLAETQIYCCRGDALRCSSMERDAAYYICNNIISSKIMKFCGKEALEKNEVLSYAENDDKPSDLPPVAQEFIQDKDVCRHYAENQAAHLGRFRYENGRRHPELPQYLLLRHAEEYEKLLKSCCAVEHPEQCLSQFEGQLEKLVAVTLELFNLNCDLYATVGDYHFQNIHLINFTTNVPQLTFDELYKYTKEVTETARECCQWNATKRLACTEQKVETVLGRICSRHQQKPINAQVGKCCSDSYPLWLQCFSDLGIDADYTPTAFEPEFHSNLCSLDERALDRKKQKLLVNLVKYKPDITEEQLTPITTEFQTQLMECCKAENGEECFKEKRQALTDRIKAISGSH